MPAGPTAGPAAGPSPARGSPSMREVEPKDQPLTVSIPPCVPRLPPPDPLGALLARVSVQDCGFPSRVLPLLPCLCLSPHPLPAL